MCEFIKKWVVIIIIIAAAQYLIVPPYDDTDAPNKRSGLSVFIDNKTQLQYLGTFGGLTPRLAADGHHMRAGE